MLSFTSTNPRPSHITPKALSAFISQTIVVLGLVLTLISNTVCAKQLNYPTDDKGDLCNGHALLCLRAFNDISFLGTRASAAYGDKGNSTLPITQYKDIKTQLADGVRALDFNLFPDPGGSSDIHVCFPDCSVIDSGSLQDILSQVASWLNDNPRNVVSIFLENTGGVPSAGVADAFKGAGLDTKALKADPTAGWPTLGEIIGDDKSIVVFGDKGSIVDGKIPYILPYNQNMLIVDQTKVTDKSWQCGPYGDHGSKSTLMIPHFYLQSANVNGKQYDNLPYPVDLSLMNSWKLMEHTQQCRGAQAIWANFIMVDFYDQGNSKDMLLGFNSLPIPGDKVSNYYPDFKAYGGGSSTIQKPTLLAICLLSILTTCFGLRI
ncbi:hypothetical protein H4219_003207 [Mycoemilia scoparia]|uniref:PLC-like phosphodiesterase n=1 Tax=Mycoemilia scoparia TaxID=417184 RepID=A0A9W7ZZE5_9FUNG|nr:hypothetical protein H4219_003207 [Mycoemilia scoparia]